MQHRTRGGESRTTTRVSACGSNALLVLSLIQVALLPLVVEYR